MAFGDAYLEKAGIRDALFDSRPRSGLQLIVIIPVYNESGLERCLDSLFQCHGMQESDAVESGAAVPDPPVPDAAGSGDRVPLPTDVLILINAPSTAPTGVLERNRETLAETGQWIREHTHPFIRFHVALDHAFDPKEAGVGLARKILMDEAVRRFSLVRNPRGIIASLDADIEVEPNYLEALGLHFTNPDREGCSVYFEHRFDPDAPDVTAAIVQYELHLRYYLQSLRSTGFPFAFHTVGSCMAVRADVYCKEGGMNRRKGGEDFYFIQKVAQRGRYNDCTSTCIRPSPRPSGRVPFGTGPVIQRLLNHGGSLTTYHPEPFRMLARLFHGLDTLYSKGQAGSFLNTLDPLLLEFLRLQDVTGSLEEIRRNCASLASFRKRFWRWFTMFRILKFLHFARENGYPDVPVTEAATEWLRRLESSGTDAEWSLPAASPNASVPGTAMELLLLFRKLERNGFRMGG